MSGSAPLVAARVCASYRDAQAAIGDLLGELALPDLSGKRALLKVNLMYGTPPEAAITTHPEVVRAVVRAVHAAGGQAVIAESSGIVGFTDEALETTGMAAVAREEGAELLNLDSGPFERVRVPGAQILDEVLVHRALLEADLRVTVPKLKTHDLATLTCALKNQFGLLPGGTKCAVHLKADTPRKLALAIADVNRAVPFDLGVVDAVVGLHGGSNQGGRPISVGLVAASRDLVALDAICAELVGVPADSVPSTVAAGRLGLGEADPGRVRLTGTPLRPIVRFEPAGWNAKRLAPIARAAYYVRASLVHPTVIQQDCTECGDCATICPVGAIRLTPKPVIDTSCVHCHACSVRCPEGAIKLRPRRLLGNTLRRKAAPMPLEALL